MIGTRNMVTSMKFVWVKFWAIMVAALELKREADENQCAYGQTKQVWSEATNKTWILSWWQAGILVDVMDMMAKAGEALIHLLKSSYGEAGRLGMLVKYNCSLLVWRIMSSGGRGRLSTNE